MLIHPDNKEVIRGRHRGVTRRHRSAHRGDYASILARMVPAWTLSPGRGGADRPDRGPRSGPGTHQGRTAVLGNDLRPSARSADGALEIDLRAVDVAVVDRVPFDVEQLEGGLLSDEALVVPTAAAALDHTPSEATVDPGTGLDDAAATGTGTAPPDGPEEDREAGGRLTAGTEEELELDRRGPGWHFEDILSRLRSSQAASRIANRATNLFNSPAPSIGAAEATTLTQSGPTTQQADPTDMTLAYPMGPDTAHEDPHPNDPTRAAAMSSSPILDDPSLDDPILDDPGLDDPDRIETDLSVEPGWTQSGADDGVGGTRTQAQSATLDPEYPIWDPTGRHSGAGAPTHPSERRRFSFADMLGFGDDTETFSIDDLEGDLAAEGDRSWADFPTLASVAVDDAPTNQLVERLWHATAEHPIAAPADQLAPVDIQELFRSNRTFRWSVLAGAVIVLIVALFTLRAVGQRPVTVAEERALEYSQGIDAVASSLLGFESTARTIANPATDTSALGALTGDLLLVGGAARRLAESAGEPLPEPSLLGPSAAIDRLQSPQELLRQAAEATLTVERRLGDAVSYRVLIDQAFVTSELPVAARESELGDIGAHLSVVQATSERALAQLPDDAFFASHADAASALLDSFETWQVQYLDALRQGDVAAAGVLRRDWQNAHAAFTADIATPLMAMDEWSAEEIEHIRGLLAVATERLGDGSSTGQ